MGRLLEAATPRGQERFQFDPAGNLLDPNPPAQAPANLLSNLLADYAGRHYRYDDRGNLLEKRHNGQRTAFEWDAFNRLRRLTRPDGAQVEYHYDPLGRRLAKVGAEGVVFYGWDGDTLAFETRSTGAIHYLFEPASFTPLAQVHTAPIEGLRVPAWGAHIPYDPEADPLRASPPEPEPPRAIFYYHTDHLGTPQLLTDAAGQQALEMEYQAWGAAREILTQAAQSAGLRNPLRFQGQYHDDESGLHYNRYRYYDPDTGRFISRDPIGLLGGMNVHAYAPNPVEWVDPLGLSGYKISANTATPDTLARGVHVNVHGPGLPAKGGHITLSPDEKSGSVVPLPADKATRDMSSSQWKKACQCLQDYLDNAKNVEKLQKTAQGGVDMHQGSSRSAELSNVGKILGGHLSKGTNPMVKK